MCSWGCRYFNIKLAVLYKRRAQPSSKKGLGERLKLTPLNFEYSILTMVGD